jgi:hypothetical protein
LRPNVAKVAARRRVAKEILTALLALALATAGCAVSKPKNPAGAAALVEEVERELAPTQNSARAAEWLVRVAHSTLNPHALDSRHPGTTGLGTGTIGLLVDERGAPTAFYWRGAPDRTRSSPVRWG